MASMSQEEWTLIARSMRVWMGYGSCAWPRTSDERLVGEVGSVEAARLLPILKEVRADYCSSEAHRMTGDLNEMTDIATEQYAERHPGVPGELLEVLEWYYSFNMR